MTDNSPQSDPSDDDSPADTGDGFLRRWVALGLVVLGGLGLAAAWLAPDGPPADAAKSEARVDAPETDESTSTSASVDEPPESLPAPPSDVPPPTDVDLTGTWAHRSIQTTITDIPVGGEVTSKTITYRVTDIRQDGERVELRPKVCDTTIESNSGSMRTIIPDAFIETIPVTERRATLTTAAGTPTLKVDHSCDVRGAELDEPASGELPTSTDDDRVVDGDDDGHPGVTVELEGTISGKIYLAQRGCDSFEGPIVSEDHVQGTVDWSTEQEVLDSSSMFLKSKPDSRPHEDAEKSWFEMRRVDGDVTCEALMERPVSYFER